MSRINEVIGLCLNNNDRLIPKLSELLANVIDDGELEDLEKRIAAIPDSYESKRSMIAMVAFYKHYILEIANSKFEDLDRYWINSIVRSAEIHDVLPNYKDREAWLFLHRAYHIMTTINALGL